MTLKTRFSILFSFVFSVLVLVFGLFVYAQLKTKLIQAAEQTLNEHSEHELRHLAMHHDTIRGSSDTLHNNDIRYLIKKNGVVAFSSLSPGERGDEAKYLSKSIVRTWDSDRIELHTYYNLGATLNYLATLQRTLFLACLFAIALTFPVSYFFTKALLKPFGEFARQTAALDAENLSFRFSEPRHRDEYGVLVRGFNSLLKRIEATFEQVRRFATNASHELRTPVTVIRGEAEVLLRKPRERADYEVGLRKIVTHADHLQRMVNRLLFLADLERLEQEPQNTPIDVAGSIRDVCETLQQVTAAEKKTIEFNVPVNAKYIGHRELFLSVTTNLIENAIKYAGARILIQVVNDAACLRLTVDDDGPGISPAHRENVFQPFFRSVSPGTNPAGHGLGLAIVKACVDAAGGSIELQNSTLGGLSVVVNLPYTA